MRRERAETPERRNTRCGCTSFFQKRAVIQSSVPAPCYSYISSKPLLLTLIYSLLAYQGLVLQLIRVLQLVSSEDINSATSYFWVTATAYQIRSSTVPTHVIRQFRRSYSTDNLLTVCLTISLRYTSIELTRFQFCTSYMPTIDMHDSVRYHVN